MFKQAQSLLILYFSFFLLWLPIYGSENLELPSADINLGQNWDVIHIYGDPSISPKSLPLQEAMPGFSAATSPEAEDQLFQVKLDRYIQHNLATMKEHKISLVRFVADQQSPMSKSQQAAIRETLKKYGLSPRFETITIDWDKRQKLLAEQGNNKGHEFAEQIEGTKAKEFFTENYHLGISAFFKDIYTRPEKSEWAGGTVKMSTTIAITTTAWQAMGVSATSPIFWVLSTKLFFTELMFGPYIKTYLNFLGKKVAKTFGDGGVAMYGQIQGFLLFSFDKYFLHLYDPSKISPPWDPHFLMNFFGVSFLGGLMGSFLPSGIIKLTTKGWLSRSAGSINMQMLDLIMPLEGAFLAMDSPWLWPIFLIHNGIKFSYYLAGSLLPTRGQIIFTTSNIAKSDEFLREFTPEQIINRRYFEEQLGILRYLESKNVSSRDKITLLKYFSKQSNGLKTPGATEAALFQNVFHAYGVYLYNIRLNNPESYHKDKSYHKILQILQLIPERYRPLNLPSAPISTCLDYLRLLFRNNF